MRLAAIAPSIILAAFAASASQAAGVVAVPTGFTEEILVQGLDQPNSMSFLPDGRLFITEQVTGRIRLVVDGHIAATDPCGTVAEVSSDDAERGLQGIAVDPRWPVFPYVYVCYTRVGPREVVARYTASGDLSDPHGEHVTLASPLVLLGNLRDQFGNHNGGGVRFGKDDMLYVSLGEDADRCSAQHPDSLRGCLLRMDVMRLPPTFTGVVPRALLIPADNPLSGPDSNARLVYAFGLRNPWRFHVDPQTGAIVAGDVGENVMEEIDSIRAGGNYGWPFREGTELHTQPECLEPGGAGSQTYTAPVLALDRSTGYSAILTAGYYRPVPGASANWPVEYWGDVFFGDYYECRLRRLRPSAGWSSVAPVPGQPNTEDWTTGMFWCADFAVGPDGSLWWLKSWDDSFDPSSGMVRRIRYLGASTAAPWRASPRVALNAAPNPFRSSVEFSANGAPDGTARLTVFDLAGRKVAEPWRGDSGGLVRATWDGREPAGAPVPPGVYPVLFEGAGFRRSLLLLRLR